VDDGRISFPDNALTLVKLLLYQDIATKSSLGMVSRVVSVVLYCLLDGRTPPCVIEISCLGH
jgi:hypothetical protein